MKYKVIFIIYENTKGKNIMQSLFNLYWHISIYKTYINLPMVYNYRILLKGYTCTWTWDFLL